MEQRAENKTLERADHLLAELALSQDILVAAEMAAEVELAKARAKYAPLVAEAKEALASNEKALLEHIKKHRATLFDHTDQVDLAHGILLHGEEFKVKIPRNAVAAIEAQGWEEALKRTVSVDRGVVEKWPTERLVAIGAERKSVETYTYEIKD